jgi:hypothetical protein
MYVVRVRMEEKRRQAAALQKWLKIKKAAEKLAAR